MHLPSEVLLYSHSKKRAWLLGTGGLGISFFSINPIVKETPQICLFSI